MQTYRCLTELPERQQPLWLAIGVFDGVHIGHQRVISQTTHAARAGGGRSVVLTFEPHPVRVLAPANAPPLLTATEHKLRLIAQLGVDACVVQPFDATFAAWTPEQFVSWLASTVPGLREIHVGARFRFGCQRSGDVALLRRLAAPHGFRVVAVPTVEVGGHLVSSTAIRHAIQQGDLQRAAAMLGRPVSILGTVVAGDQRGRQLGFPTANVAAHHEAIPPHGVYAVRIRLDNDQLYAGMANIGVRPTVTANGERTIEVHLLDFQGDLYGREIEVLFVQKIRPEQKFATLAALQQQLTRDAATVRSLLAASEQSQHRSDNRPA